MARGQQRQQYGQGIATTSGTGAIPVMQASEEEASQPIDVMFPKMGGPEPAMPNPFGQGMRPQGNPQPRIGQTRGRLT